jgi:transposase
MLKTISQLTLERNFLQDCFCQAGETVPRILEYDSKG